jgi:two-component system chemotaxis sensor kinase CheA
VLKFLEGGSRASVELDEADYLGIVQAIDRGAPKAEVLQLIASWRDEPVRVRFERFAEQAQALATRLGKGPIEVVTEGSHLRLPRERFAKVWASLTHVLRNAIDHGLYPREERPGALSLFAKLDRRELVVSVRDNGRGIDWAKVRERARRSGMPAATEHELQAALFASGFSTREAADEFSGRGVGMGAVKEAVEALGGRVTLHSSIGNGTEVQLHFPVSVLDHQAPRAAA